MKPLQTAGRGTRAGHAPPCPWPSSCARRLRTSEGRERRSGDQGESHAQERAARRRPHYVLRTSFVKPLTKIVVSAQPTAITVQAAQRVQPVGSQSPAWPKSTIGRNVSAA